MPTERDVSDCIETLIAEMMVTTTPTEMDAHAKHLMGHLTVRLLNHPLAKAFGAAQLPLDLIAVQLAMLDHSFKCELASLLQARLAQKYERRVAELEGLVVEARSEAQIPAELMTAPRSRRL